MDEVTAERWRGPERERARRALALGRYDAFVAADLAGAEAFLGRAWIEPVDANLPMILISEVQRSGGTLLSRLLDGHPDVHSYPLELFWGSPTEYDWPPGDLLAAPVEDAFRELAAGNVHQIAEFTSAGYRKTDRGGGEQRLPFIFSLALQRREFIRRLAVGPAGTRRELLGAFMSAFFTGWLDYQSRYGEPRFVSAFAKRHNFWPTVEEFFADYPDGHLLTIIRDPASWYASASVHSAESYGDVEQAMELWRASTLASCAAHRRWPDRVVLLGFESLVDGPEPVMRTLCERLGLRWHDQLRVPTMNGRPVLSNSSFRPVLGIDRSAVSRGARLTPREVEFIRQTAQPLYDESRSIWLWQDRPVRPRGSAPDADPRAASPCLLTWPALEQAHEYRVLVRDLGRRGFVADHFTSQCSWEIAPRTLGSLDHLSWQVRWRARPEDDWKQLLPELPLPAEPPVPPPGSTILTWEDIGASAYRVLIRDQDNLLLKLPVLGTTYAVDWSALPPNRSYRWRLQAWDIDAGAWSDLEPYAPVVRRVARARPDQPPLLAGPPRLLLLFTIDTEANLRYAANADPSRAIDEQIFGGRDGERAGIPMILDALDRHGFRGTFFLDILAEYQFGEGSLEPVVEHIKSRGHDIQLHVHTAPHLRFASDSSVRDLAEALPSFDADRFRRVLEVAVRRFIERVGEEPVAYRSGAYTICDSYLEALPEFGLRIDSSIYAFKNCRVSPWLRCRTQPFRIGPLLEIPVTWRLEWRSSGPVPLQFAPFRLGGDSNQSFTMVAAPASQAPMALVYLAHSYQYLTRGPDVGDVEQQLWHRRVSEQLLREEHAGLYDATDPPWFFQGADDSRMELLERNLDELCARGDVHAVTMATVANEYFHAWDDRGRAIDPLSERVEGHDQRHLTGTRVYSADFLRHLECAAVAPDP